MNYHEVPLEQLPELRETLEIEIVRIKGQVECAKRKARKTGEYSDPAWFSRATYALRRKGIEHQKLLRVQADRLKAQRAAGSQSFSRLFIDIARRRLEPDLFNSILTEAKDSNLPQPQEIAA